MSELQVTTLETTDTISANVIVGSNTTVNSTGLYIGSNVSITNNYISGTSELGTVSLAPTINAVGIIIGNTNVFPNSNDVYAWVSGATGNNNSTYTRDYSIEPSPFGGIPMKITPSGSDPYPGTYNSNTWNLAKTVDGDVWKFSGYIRTDIDVNLTAYDYTLIIPANSSGQYGTAGYIPPLPNLSLSANKWKYFESVFTLTGYSGNANTAYIQIRPDGEQSGTANTWYDGLKLEKVETTIYGETVNTQIFTSNSIWVKPAWATTGNELVIVHMWGGGGGGSSGGGGGGGGAFVLGYYKANQCNNAVSVIVGRGGAANAVGENSSFNSNGTVALVAYGGANGSTSGGAGGGWFSAGSGTTGGGPLGGTAGSDSTFGGGGSTTNGGSSIYGGGAGARTTTAGNSVFGGAGGRGSSSTSSAGFSIFGGQGGSNSAGGNATTPGGGGSALVNQSGARGEVRVYTLRYIGS